MATLTITLENSKIRFKDGLLDLSLSNFDVKLYQNENRLDIINSIKKNYSLLRIDFAKYDSILVDGVAATDADDLKTKLLTLAGSAGIVISGSVSINVDGSPVSASNPLPVESGSVGKTDFTSISIAQGLTTSYASVGNVIPFESRNILGIKIEFVVNDSDACDIKVVDGNDGSELANNTYRVFNAGDTDGIITLEFKDNVTKSLQIKVKAGTVGITSGTVTVKVN